MGKDTFSGLKSTGENLKSEIKNAGQELQIDELGNMKVHASNTF